MEILSVSDMEGRLVTRFEKGYLLNYILCGMIIPVDEREYRLLTSYKSHTRLSNVCDCLVHLQGRMLKALDVPSGSTSSIHQDML